MRDTVRIVFLREGKRASEMNPGGLPIFLHGLLGYHRCRFVPAEAGIVVLFCPSLPAVIGRLMRVGSCPPPVIAIILVVPSTMWVATVIVGRHVPTVPPTAVISTSTVATSIHSIRTTVPTVFRWSASSSIRAPRHPRICISLAAF